MVYQLNMLLILRTRMKTTTKLINLIKEGDSQSKQEAKEDGITIIDPNVNNVEKLVTLHQDVL